MCFWRKIPQSRSGMDTPLHKTNGLSSLTKTDKVTEYLMYSSWPSLDIQPKIRMKNCKSGWTKISNFGMVKSEVDGHIETFTCHCEVKGSDTTHLQNLHKNCIHVVLVNWKIVLFWVLEDFLSYVYTIKVFLLSLLLGNIPSFNVFLCESK